MMVADEFYDGKPWIYLTEQELKKGLELFAGVDAQQTINVDLCRQIFRMLKMDASMPVDSSVFMQTRTLRKYLAGSELTDVVKPGGRTYTLKRGKVLVKAIVALIEPLEFRRKVGIEMRSKLTVHYPDVLFNIIDQQRRDQAVIEANDAARRQRATEHDARSVAAGGNQAAGQYC